jgi:hypothetical protein
MKNYPKTYEECCEVLHVTSENIEKKVKYESEALKNYQRVIVCRDAYRSTYDIEKYGFPEKRYIINVVNGKLVKEVTTDASFVLSFYTEKMRDAFYDNFEKDILKVCGIL